MDGSVASLHLGFRDGGEEIAAALGAFEHMGMSGSACALRAGHDEKIYTLSGPEALTYDDVADELSKVLGRVIRHVSLPAADLRAGMLAEGMPEAIADRMLDLERYFREDRAGTITDDVKRVTGRAPRRFADYVRDTASTGVWNADVASAVS